MEKDWATAIGEAFDRNMNSLVQQSTRARGRKAISLYPFLKVVSKEDIIKILIQVNVTKSKIKCLCLCVCVILELRNTIIPITQYSDSSGNKKISRGVRDVQSKCNSLASGPWDTCTISL